MSETNIGQQGADRPISELSDKIPAFESNPRLSELQMRSNNSTHFLILWKQKSRDAKKYAEEIQLLQQ
jgi:hypothetical protein